MKNNQPEVGLFDGKPAYVYLVQLAKYTLKQVSDTPMSKARLDNYARNNIAFVSAHKSPSDSVDEVVRNLEAAISRPKIRAFQRC